MKAIVMHGIGGIEQLEYASIADPVPKKDEVLLKVLYCGINHLDILIRQGKRPGPKKFPHILGSEIVGKTPEGEVVVVYPWVFCGKCDQCKSGNEQICDSGGTMGRTKRGGYAEYVAVPKKNLVLFSKEILRFAQDDKEEMDLVAVCSVVLAGTTACHLVRRAQIPDKTVVLVTGATGGVGTLVVQLLKHKKCTVICATSHANKIPLLKKLGADYVVSIENMIHDVKKIASNGVQYAIDIVGGDTWSNVLTTLGKNGTMVFCSTSREEIGKVDIGNAFAKQVNILGSYGGSIEDFKTALDLVKKGFFRPVIDSVFSLEDAKKAQEKMENQALFGKILLAT